MAGTKKTIIEYRHYSLPMDFPVLVLTGERWKISDIRSERLHFHNCLEIGICHQDNGYMDIGSRTYAFEPNQVTCIPRFLPHTTYSKPGESSLWSYIFFDPEELFRDLISVPKLDFEKPSLQLPISSYLLDIKTYPTIYPLALQVVGEFKEKKPLYKEVVKGLLQALYIELIRIYSQVDIKKQAAKHPSTSNAPITKETLESDFILLPALNHIHQHYTQVITIDELATLCNLSTTHFRRTFNSIMGSSPLSFINSTRIDEACRLLKSTEDTILSISEKVGFQSISSFNRSFSKMLNTTPREWRNTIHEKEIKSAKATILEFSGWI